MCARCALSANPVYLLLIPKPSPSSCTLGCGTMGVAITSGVLASLHSLHGLNPATGQQQPKWESHTPGTSTPAAVAENCDDDDSDDLRLIPSRFIACVQREESASRLREKFGALLGGDAVEVTVGENVSAVRQSDVVLLWYVRAHARTTHASTCGSSDTRRLRLTYYLPPKSAANHRVRIPYSARVGSKTLWLARCSSASLPASPSRNSPPGFFPALR